MNRIKKLYFVDDSDDEYFMTSLMFQMQNIELELVHFADFGEFFERLNSGNIEEPTAHLFLIDMNLTVMKGTDGVKSIRGQDRWADLIVGICSGSEDPADVSSAIEAGADVFAPKPLDKSCLELICSTIADLHLIEGKNGSVELYRSSPKTAAHVCS